MGLSGDESCTAYLAQMGELLIDVIVVVGQVEGALAVTHALASEPFKDLLLLRHVLRSQWYHAG